MSAPASAGRPSPGPAARGAGRLLVGGALLGLLVGAALGNLGTAVVEHDESGTFGAACEHVEATIIGGPGGLLVGLVAAAVWYLLRRRTGSVALAAVGAGAGAVVALLVVSGVLHPLATSYLPVFVCPY